MKNRNKIVAGSLSVLMVVAIGAGWYTRRRAERMRAVYNAFSAALVVHQQGVSLFRADRLEEADARFAELQARIDAHTGNAPWDALRSYAQEGLALCAYGRAEKEWTRYVLIRRKTDTGTYPDAKKMLEDFQKLQTTFAALEGKPGFSDPQTAWWLKNAQAVSAAWQLVVRAVMLEGKYADLKPIYDVSLVLLKDAMPLAEKSGRWKNERGEEEQPALIVSQNLDFMTRLGEELQKQRQRQQPQPQQDEQEGEGDESQKMIGSPRRGLGDFLSRAMRKGKNGQGQTQGMGMMLSGTTPNIGRDFLPLPQKGIGTQRLPAQGTR